MDAANSNLMKLRPVPFRYKQDLQGERQYGLMAEEVLPLYSELVSYDMQGNVVTVRYHELVPMLLNELQKQNVQLQDQARRNRQQAEQIKTLAAQAARDRIATVQKIAQLEANQERELRAMQADFEQHLPARERSKPHAMLRPVKF